MDNPANNCFERASLLLNHLNKLGFNAQLITIDKAPLLIAPLLDSKDNFKKEIINYKGTHGVVSIMANDGNEYILDPQFAEKPMLKSEYFIKTIGRECIENEMISNIWQCNYKKSDIEPPATSSTEFNIPGRRNYEQDGFLDNIEQLLKGKVEHDCGFIHPKDHFWFSQKNSPVNSKTPDVITDKKRGEIIVAKYQKFYLLLKNSDGDLHDYRYKSIVENYKEQLVEFEDYIQSVCEKFMFSQKECLEIRTNYENYIKGKEV